MRLRDLEMEKRDPRTVAAIILGGGAGTGLFPLTKRSFSTYVDHPNPLNFIIGAKKQLIAQNLENKLIQQLEFVPIGGAYRLIDVPMSNCINSGIIKVYILTQFDSASLNRHLARAYNFGNGINFGDGYVEVLATTQTPGEAGKKWFQGTADAVRQFHWLFEDARSKEIEDVVILSGDHLYRMDYMDFIQNHRQSGSDITIACLPMDDSHASDFGLMKIDNKGRVLSFSEKPKGDDLKAMVTLFLSYGSRYESFGTLVGIGRKETIYCFHGSICFQEGDTFESSEYGKSVQWRFPTANDFGSEIIPASAKEFFIKVCIQSCLSVLHIYLMIIEKTLSQSNPFLRRTSPLLHIHQDLVFMMQQSRCIRQEETYHHQRLTIARIALSNENDTVMLGADYYETEAEVTSLLAEGRVPIGIGENTKIRDCIIDKNERIGKDAGISNSELVLESDAPTYSCIDSRNFSTIWTIRPPDFTDLPFPTHYCLLVLQLQPKRKIGG
ncbi:hypothetical protein HHK36_026713 [Tetracentron sinense]|uniref:glucose-1-phosphate adenylyltransferase n=1 Tax=Tetracentron sinense TaxID=13715 RepID=A0A834YG09_TETSI|nr:hypothetical protein HHK36_026713 [Tetracentron sinense]